MVGVGCGARSYTRALHYTTEYAVRARGIREILADYVARPDEAFERADYGFHLRRSSGGGTSFSRCWLARVWAWRRTAAASAPTPSTTCPSWASWSRSGWRGATQSDCA